MFRLNHDIVKCRLFRMFSSLCLGVSLLPVLNFYRSACDNFQSRLLLQDNVHTGQVQHT